jgi:hypothetical protein
MKNILDNKLQELLVDKAPGKGIELSIQEMQELKVYEKLVEVLDNQPISKLPPDFSTKVTGIIQQRKDRKNNILLYTLFGSLLIPAIFFFILLINNEVIKQVADLFTHYKGIILFSISFVILIHFADRKLILKLNTAKWQ